jgi:class 3 adenylate cyclase
MPEIPSGTVTFLFTDFEGSTRLWEHYPEQMKTAFARQQPVRAATIFAANRDWYRRVERSMTSHERAGHDAWLSATQQALGEEAFATAWAAGQAMTIEQAVQYALNPSLPLSSLRAPRPFGPLEGV